MTHESRCIEFPCTCVIILRERLAKLEADKFSNDTAHLELMRKYSSLERKLADGLSCCCYGCTKHNQDLSEKVTSG